MQLMIFIFNLYAQHFRSIYSFIQVLCGDSVDDKGEPITVGSVAGGGRYDGLVGMFDPKNRLDIDLNARP